MPRLGLLVCVVALAAGCGGDAPRGAPDYEGVVESVGPTTMAVRHGADACGRIEFRATDGVTVRRGDEEIAWTDVREGDRVSVWAGNGVDDSCPQLGGAEHIVVASP